MKHLLILFVSAFFWLGCKTSQPLVVVSEDSVPILCGTFEASNSKSLFNTITLSGWNTAEFTTSFDGVAHEMEETPDKTPVRPPSRYFIGGDTLYIEVDKGYLCYKIKDENTLLGIDMWNGKEKLIRKKEKADACPKTHTLTADEKTWLRQSRSYFQAYYHGTTSMLERVCEDGYGPACMTLGIIELKLMQNPEKGLSLLEKACEMGYYGNYACFRLGDVLSDQGKEEAAAIAYQKACDGGHSVGCMAAGMMGGRK